MMDVTPTKAIEQKLAQLLENEPGLFLVELIYKPGNVVKLFIDGDQGVSIGQLASLNRALYKWAEEISLFPNNDFSMEVSSPGLGEPLKLHRQYKKNNGRFVEVIQKDGIKTEGKLINVSENEIVVEEERGKGKKRELIPHTILFDEIKTTKVQIKF